MSVHDQARVQTVIGHLKEHHRMGRNYLAHASGDAINAVLAAAGTSAASSRG
jgi:transposase, IS5 family